MKIYRVANLIMLIPQEDEIFDALEKSISNLCDIKIHLKPMF